MTNPVIDPAYILPDTNSQRYPALQADNYQPKGTKDKIRLCFAAASIDLISPTEIERFDFDIEDAIFGDNETSLFIPKVDVRWVILKSSRIFGYDKETKFYCHLPRGTKLAGTKKVTAAKVFLAAIIDGELVLADDGKPQIFALNLKSSKTALIKSQNPAPGDGTIHSLNIALNKHYGLKGTLTHLVSVGLETSPEKYTSSVTGDNSWGIKFRLTDNATPLKPEQQKAIFELLQDPQLQKDIEDPYRLAAIPSEPEPAIEPELEAKESIDTYIPF